MVLATLALGSNMGNRLQYLQSAIDGLSNNSEIEILRISHVYETKPLGGPKQDYFLNAVVEVETSLSPTELLEAVQKFEADANRVRDLHWGPRTLDIDILIYADVVSDSPKLTIPHPRIGQRAFVLIPWFEINPEVIIPKLGKLSEIYHQIPKSDVRLNRDMKLQVSK